MTERAQTKIPAIDPFRITNHKSRITSRRVEFAMLALVVIWGVNFPIVKIAFREMTPMVFNALRFGSATVLLLAVSWRTREPLPPRAAWPGLVGLGIIGHAIYQISFINGLALATAGNSALLLSTVRVCIAALTALAVAVGYVFWYASVQAVGGPRTAIYSNLIPIVALLASWLLLGESLGPVQAAGAAVVLAGVSLARS